MPNNNGGLLRKQSNVYYVMRFGDYYTGDYGIRGRIIELATIKGDGSYTYENGYVLGEMRKSAVFLFTDLNISVLVNSLNVYNHHVDDSFVNFPFNALLEGDNDEIAGNPYFDGKIKEASDNVYFALDPNWNNNDSDSSTPRVQIAQGQSDITRHESYFKKELSPNYEGAVDIQEELENLMTYLHVSNVEDITFVATPGYVGNKSINVLSHYGMTDPRTGSATTIVFNSIPDPNQQSDVVRQGYGCYSFGLDLPGGIYPFDYSLTSRVDDEFTNSGLAIYYFYISPQLLKYLDGKAKMETRGK